MSVAGAIATAIATKITALEITGATVVKRKKPGQPSGKNPLEIVVSVGDVVSVEALSARKDLVTRLAAVAVVKAGGKVTGDDDAFRDVLEQVRVAVNAKATFAGVGQFNRIDPTKETPFDRAALDKDLNYGLLAFSIETVEDRS